VKPEILEKLLNESECTYLDFKQAQYPFVGATDDVKSELLKDILALADAEKPADGYILIGVEEVRGARAKVHGVTAHLNDHDLQQFVNSKTQRSLRFSYEVVPCDGVTIGVICVPIQERPFFLKADYGRLRRNTVYYRLGSSTKEATPEELIRWSQQLAAKDDEPVLELQFARIKRVTVIGGSSVTEPIGTTVKIETRESAPLTLDEIARIAPPPPRLAFSDDHEYFQKFAKFVHLGLRLAPLGFTLTNSGGVTAMGIHVRLRMNGREGVILLTEERYPPRPLHKTKLSKNGGGLRDPMMASYTRFRQEDITVKRDGGITEIEWNVAKVLPKLPVFSDGVFFVGAQESRTVEFF
jgi:hypothetical protein